MQLFSVVRVLCLYFISFTFSISPNNTQYQDAFSKFIKQFNKHYDTNVISERYEIFKDNYDIIIEHNAGNHTFQLGITQFADLTNKEFKEKYLNYSNNNNNTPTKRKPTPENTSNPLPQIPDEIDWTKKGVVTPVKDQGQCGSCWAFSTTGGMEGAYALSTGKLLSFSEQQLVDCSKSAGNNGCAGGLMPQTYKWLLSNPPCSETDYAYTGKDGTCKKCTPAAKLKNYTATISPANEDGLQQALVNQPISVGVEADGYYWQHYKSGIITGPCGTNLDHGVLVVGYGVDNNVLYWKVKNSWGNSWGESGYLRLVRGVYKQYGQCGIAMEPSYPGF